MPDEADVRWLSYTELAEARGIDRLSAMRTVRNRRWEKRRGNDGTIRVAVPRNFLENASRRGRENPSESQREIPAENPSEISRKIMGLEAKIGLLSEQLEHERNQVRDLTERVVTLREERAAAIARGEGYKAEAERLGEQLTQARERADGGEARLDELLTDLRGERTALQLLQTESAVEQRKLTERIAELEAQLAKQNEPPVAEPPDPDVEAIRADLEHESSPPSEWLEEAWGAGANNDHSATADPAHQVERLWQRIEELEMRLEAEKAERAGEKPPTSADQAAATAQAEGDTVPEAAARPRRWWRRVLRRP